MITKTRHTGIVVRNLPDAIQFYLGLGLELSIRQMEEGEFIDRVVSFEDVKLETAKLMAPCGYILELLQYHSHPDAKEKSPQLSNRLGCSHISFTVDSLSETLNLIRNSGGDAGSEGQISPNGKLKVAYCHDPEGNLLELVEELNAE